MDIQFFYIRRPNLLDKHNKIGVPVLTMAFMLDGEGTVYFGKARCSDKDSFCYSVARKIAVGRMTKLSKLTRDLDEYWPELLDSEEPKCRRQYITKYVLQTLIRDNRDRFAKFVSRFEEALHKDLLT